jgi:hypothetical protein
LCVLEASSLKARQPIRSTLAVSPEAVAAILADIESNVKARRRTLSELERRRTLDINRYLQLPPFARLSPVEDVQPLTRSGLDERAWHDELLRIARRHASDDGREWTCTGGPLLYHRWQEKEKANSWWDPVGDGDWSAQGERDRDMTLSADTARLAGELPRMESMDDCAV